VTRSKLLLFVLAVIAAVALGVSPAMAEPKDQTPFVKPPASANVYVPPADLWGQQDARSPDAIDAAEGRLPGALPAAPQWPANPKAIVPASADDDGVPWLEIGLGLGGVVLLAGGGVALRRTRRRRTVA
jgi:hypothetical protein